MSDETKKNCRPLDIDQTAWLLIRKYGDDCAVVAQARSQCCARHQDLQRSAEWRLVVHKVIELHFAPRKGPLH